jgi:hypothetical protein
MLIFVLPWLALLTGTNWVLESVGAGYIDPWVYLGFFLDLSGHLRTFGYAYNASRLSWILPGHLIFAAFPPLVARYVLHVGLFYVATFSLYLILKATTSFRAALLSTAFMGFYCFFLFAAGWDYVDGAGITYLLLTILALTYAAVAAHSKIWLTMAGASCAAMVYCHLFLIFFVPSLLLYYLLIIDRHQLRRLLLAALFTGYGFLAVTLAFGLVNYAITGNFLFFVSSFKYASSLTRASNAWWQVPLGAWVRGATWMILPTAVFLSSLIFVFLVSSGRIRFDRRVKLLITPQVCFLISSSIMIALYLLGQPSVQVFYYASFLIPLTFLALGTQLELLLAQLSRQQFGCVMASCVLILMLAGILPRSRLGSISWEYPFLIPSTLLVGSVVLLFTRRRVAIMFSVVFLCAALMLVNSRDNVSHDVHATEARHEFLAILKSAQVVKSVAPDADLLFWYQAHDRMGKMYRAVSSEYMWGNRLINENFPSLERDQTSFQSPAPEKHIVILSEQNDAAEKANLALSRMQLYGHLIAQQKIEDGPIAWNMIFIEAQSVPGVENVQVNAQDWPERILLRLGLRDEEIISPFSSAVLQRFRSEVNDSHEWEINRYGGSGDLMSTSNCVLINQSCGIYSSGDPRDHLASPFLAVGDSTQNFVFFSIWAKSLKQGPTPELILQSAEFVTLAKGQKLLSREDGWVLLGNSLEIKKQEKIRLVLQVRSGSSCLLAKALVVAQRVSQGTPARASDLP